MFTSAELTRILDQELERGNEVGQHSSWPPNLETVITLKYRFGTRYKDNGLSYKTLNDPHYWYAEYVSRRSKEMLTCGFSELKR